MIEASADRGTGPARVPLRSTLIHNGLVFVSQKNTEKGEEVVKKRGKSIMQKFVAAPSPRCRLARPRLAVCSNVHVEADDVIVSEEMKGRRCLEL